MAKWSSADWDELMKLYCLLQVIGIFFVYMLAVKLEDGQQLYKYRDRYYNNAN